jgi:hypothetical protein
MPPGTANIPSAATAAADSDNPHPYPTQERMAYEATNSPSGRVDTDYYKPGNAQIVEANYGQYKDREAARAAQASQPMQYPGAMSALSMTNARGGDAASGDPFASEQRRINTARAGGAGWLGLFTSGGAQRQLNAMRLHQLNQRRLGVEEGRLGFDMSKYWQGERPLQEQELGLKERQVGIEGRKQVAEEQRYAPDTWLKNRINALYSANRPEEAAQLQREHVGKADEKQFVPGVAGGGYLVTAPGTDRQTQQWFSGMPPPDEKTK